MILVIHHIKLEHWFSYDVVFRWWRHGWWILKASSDGYSQHVNRHHWMKTGRIFDLRGPFKLNLGGHRNPWNLRDVFQQLWWHLSGHRSHRNLRGAEKGWRNGEWHHWVYWKSWEIVRKFAINGGTLKWIIYMGKAIYKWMMTEGSPMT